MCSNYFYFEKYLGKVRWHDQLLKEKKEEICATEMIENKNNF